MSTDTPVNQKNKKRTATQFFLKGLAISLPPVLTLVILIWIGRGINDYIIYPISTAVRYSIAQVIQQSKPVDELVSMNGLPSLEYCDTDYRLTKELQNDIRQRIQQSGQPLEELQSEIRNWLDTDKVYIPLGQQAVLYADYSEVAERVSPAPMPSTVTGIYMELVTYRHFQGLFGLSAFAVSLTVILLYFLGRLVTARLGGWVVHKFETVFFGRLPVVSSVYSSVKQVTDFLFSERTIEYNRVVAVEYPRRGIWSIGFVTGDGMLEITAAAGEPLVTVLIPTSPMPVTGYTMSVPRSEVLDLDITVDQAFQFCLSCGVLVPPRQQITPELLQEALTKRLADRMSEIERSEPKPKLQPKSDADDEKASS